VGFFGFFECLPTTEALTREGVRGVEPVEITAALLESVRSCMDEESLPVFRGPVNPSTNETCGLLIDGFDDPPSIMMPYNPPEYASLLEACGLRTAKDLVSYSMRTTDVPLPDELVQRAEQAVERTGVKIRTLDKKNLRDEVRRVQKVYNAAWEKNWGFIPMTPAELDHMANELKSIVEPDFVCFAEHNGEPIGFALALPDINQALRHANGRLFPLGLLRILWHSRRISRLRVLALGLLAPYRGVGIDQLMYLKIWQNGLRHGLTRGEFSWILEDNIAMRKPLERFGFRVTKTYRIYEGTTEGPEPAAEMS
jgi:GNAT superfamily N-acetyltransferase